MNSLRKSAPTPPQARGLLSGTMIRGTQIKDKTFSSTKIKQGRPRAVIRLTQGRLGQAILNMLILRFARGPNTGYRTRGVLQLAQPQPLMLLHHWRARDPL
jgi:hypothetical protein